MRTSKQIMVIIDKYRKNKKMSMEELGELTHTSRASISRYKNGSRQFPVNKAHLFAKALGISTSKLLGMNDIDYNDIRTIINSLNEDNRKSLLKYGKFLLQKQSQDQKQ